MGNLDGLMREHLIDSVWDYALEVMIVFLLSLVYREGNGNQP